MSSHTTDTQPTTQSVYLDLCSVFQRLPTPVGRASDRGA